MLGTDIVLLFAGATSTLAAYPDPQRSQVRGRWPLRQGSGSIWMVSALDEDGTTLVFTGNEPLAAAIWPGGNQPAAATLSPTWNSPSFGLISLPIPGSVTSTLAAQVYDLNLYFTDGSGQHDILLGTLEILPAPGSAPAIPIYCSIDDVRIYAPWIDDLQAPSDQAGFAVQLGRARSWLDDLIVDRFKYQSLTPTAGQPGWGAWTMFGPQQMPPSKWLRDQLNANLLIIRQKTTEICAKRALYYICKAQLGKNGEHSYQDLARGFLYEAEELVKTYVAEIDLSGTGYPSITVHCGATNLR